MASITYHHNKKTGATYVYSVQNYWDKKKKRRETGKFVSANWTRQQVKSSHPRERTRG